MKKIRWAVLCSGWGNNVIDVINEYAVSIGFQKHVEIVLLITDSEECGAIPIAEKNGIKTLNIPKKNFKNSSFHQKTIKNEIEKCDIDFIFLMNYKYLIKKELLHSFPNRIINVHPSLFPSFLATTSAIQDALAYGVKITGITTHIIDERYDRGIILQQVPIKVNSNDTFESLYPKFKKKGKKIIIRTMTDISISK